MGPEPGQIKLSRAYRLEQAEDDTAFFFDGIHHADRILLVQIMNYGNGFCVKIGIYGKVRAKAMHGSQKPSGGSLLMPVAPKRRTRHEQWIFRHLPPVNH